MDKIQLYIQEGQEIVALGKVAYDAIRGLFASGDADDDAALAKLDALYAARIDQAKKDAGGE